MIRAIDVIIRAIFKKVTTKNLHRDRTYACNPGRRTGRRIIPFII
jgi:hypothetical protein